jgi:hypothetical protein
MRPQQGCLNCPHCIRHGAIMLRSCSIVGGEVKGTSIIVECEARPELGLFEPFRGGFNCPVTEEKIVGIPAD